MMNRQELMLSRRQQIRLLPSSGNRSGVRPTDVWAAIRFTLCCLGHALFTLWRLNPVSLFIRRWRQLHYLNTRMALSIRPRLVDLVTDFFLSGERRKRNLLSWVKSILPWVGQDILDFTACWQDGIVLCALMETISPGACPGFNMLKPHHRVNNCRLGLQLAIRYLQVTHLPLSPEEMAIADEHCEAKICQLVQLLQWKYQKQGGRPKEFSNVRLEEPIHCKCQARGTGLRAGIVGRRTKFNVLTDTVTRLDILIEIRGPNNEYNKEKIVSMDRGRYMDHASLPNVTMSEDDSKTKIIEDGAGHSFLRQRSLDEDLGHLIIPFDYQCVGEGRFLVTYIPRSAGLHYITILSQGGHIQGSPFEVKVSDWVSSWNLMPKARVVPFDMLQTIEERPKDSLRPSAPSDKLKRQMSHVAHVSKHLTMMKRRILKKVITHNGEEIICDVTPSPTLSRQSSADCSDLSEDDHKSRHGHHGVKGGGRTRGKRKMLGDIDAVEEAPELSESLTPSTSSSVSNSTETSSSLSLKTSGQNKKHLLGSIRMPKTQYSDLSTPEVVITPEDDSDGPFRLMFDSDDDIFSTEPNSPDNGGVDLMAAPRQMATSILNQNNDSKSRPTMKKSNSADMPSSKRSSPVYKATDIVETFLDTLRKGCSERQRHHSGSSITRVQSMDQAVLRETSKLQNHQSRPLGEWSFDKSFLTKFTESPLPSFNTVAAVADQKKSSARLFTNGKGSPLSHLTASAIKTTGNIFKTLNEKQADVNTLTCPQCNSFVSFRGEEKLHCEKCLPLLDTSKEGNTSHDSKGEIKSALFPIDLQNFDKEFINHVTEVYDSKNMKFNGQFRSHRGSASFDFSDFQPKHKITWSQHKDFSAERKLRKSITLPFKSVSERMLFGHLSTPLDSKDLDLMKGLRYVDSTVSSESLKVVEEEDSGCKEDESLADDVQTEEVSLVSRDRTSTGLPEFSDRCRSDGEVDSDVVSRRDNLAKTKKWNTFDVESWNQDVINRNGKGRFINIFYGGEEKNNTENFEQNPEEDEILQIVIESKRQKERADDNNDNDSPCAESLISMQTEGASSKSLEESYQTSDENSPSLTLMESQRDASEGRREELVGVSPFSGLSIKSGNSDWSETDDVAAGKNGFYLKDRDATRRFFLKGDWSPQFVDLYYHADVRSLQSSARSVNAGSPSKHSYKTNSISSISPVPKDTPKQRRKSRQENFKVISLPVSQGMDTQSHDESRNTLHHNASFTPSGRSPNKSDNEGAEENRVNAYISSYLSSLSQGEPSCPLYIRRRLRPHYDQCDDQTDQRALIFPQLGLLSPAVSDPTVNNWNLANDRYASEQNQQKYHFSNMCSSCRERFEEQPVWIDNFQERTLTPTKYRQEAFKKQADNSGQHSKGYQVGDPNNRNVYSSFGGDNSSAGNIQGERTLTPTKYRTYMRPAQTMGRQMFLSGRTYLSDVCNQANSEWERRDGKSQRQWLQGNFWPIENYDLNPVPQYCTPCQCLCCTTHDMGISTSSAPYLKRRRKCIRLDESGWHDVRNSKTRLSQTGKLQQEQETQTPDSEQTPEFRFSTQMPTTHENQTSHYSNETQSYHLQHSPFQQHFNSQSISQSVNQSVNQSANPSKESSSLQSVHPEALPSSDSLSQGQDAPAAQIMISKLNDTKISTLEQDMQNTQNSKHDCSVQSEKQPVIRVDVSEYITPVTTPTHQKSENNESNCTEFKNSLEKHEVKTDIEEANKTQQKSQKELPPVHQGTPEKGEGGNQPSGMRRQSTVDTLDSGITEDGLHCHPTIYINDNYESVVSDLEDNFNIPLYIPSL